MKTARLTLTLILALAGLCAGVVFAGNAQITLTSRFSDRTAGRERILSAPKITVLEDQEGTIRVGQEHILWLNSADQLSHSRTLVDGISLRVVASVVEGRVLLKGVADRSLTDPTTFHRAEGETWGTMSRDETAFVLWMDPDETKTLPVGELTLELSAELVSLANAAPIYWQAFAALPPRPDGDDPKASTAWVAGAETALSRLHEASAMAHCDWELEYDRGPELTLPHLSKLRALTRAATERAKATMASDPERSHADLQAVLRAARHVGADPLLIAQLVRVAVESSVRELLYDALESVPADALAAWRSLLASQPAAPTLAQVLELERTTFVGYLRTQLAGPDSDAARDLRKEMGLDGAAAGPALTKMLDTADADYREMVRIAGLPPAEMTPALAAFEEQLQANGEDHVLSLQLLPAVGKAADRLQLAEAKTEALRRDLDELNRLRSEDPDAVAGWVKQVQARSGKVQ